METLALSFLDARVTVGSTVDGLAAWSRESLAPGFVDGRDAEAPPEVTIRETPAADERASGASWPCFRLGEGVASLPGRRDAGGVSLDDAYFGARYPVGARSVDVCPLGASPRLRMAAFRAVRELATARAAAPSRLELHAAALELGGRVVLLAGPKGAGKTTLLAHLAASAPAAIVANDRVLVFRNGRAVEAHGLPTVVHLRPGSARLVPRLLAELPQVAHPVDLTLAEARLVPRAGDASPRDVYVSAAQLAEAADSRLVAGGILARVAFLTIDDDEPAYRVSPLDSAERERRLAGIARRGGDPSVVTVFEVLAARGPRVSPSIALLDRIECVELRLGPRFYADRGLAARLQLELLG